MKTSNKLLLGALVVLLVSLTLYNSALKAEYLSGNYKDPYKNYTHINIKDFDEIEIDAANMMDVTVRHGKYAIHVSKDNNDSIKFTKVGNRLIINVDVTKNHQSNNPNIAHFNNIEIYCPQLTYLKTDKHQYTMPLKKLSPDEIQYFREASGDIKLRRFKLDSLSIEQKSGLITLGRDTIASLKAVTAAESRLKIEEDTHITKADLRINDRSSLQLEKFNISQFSYTLADSAEITLTSNGAMLKDALKKF